MRKILEKYNRIVESVFFAGSGLLSEEHHIIPNIEKYFNTVWACVNEVVQGNNGLFELTIDKTKFDGIECFFEQCNIHLKIEVTDNLQDFYYSGGYSPQNQLAYNNTGKTVLLSNNGNLFDLNINAVIQCYVGNLERMIASVIYHEFTHAYEDWMRIKKSQGNNSLYFYVINSNYKNINLIKQWNPPYGKNFGTVLYLISQIESRAYISSTIGELETLIRLENNNFQETLRKTVFYSNFYALFKYLKDMQNIEDTDVQNGLLMLFNKYAGVKHDGETYKFKTYNSLIKWLKKKAIFVYNKSLDTLAKYFESEVIKNSFRL